MVIVKMETSGWVQENGKKTELTELGNRLDQKLANFSINGQRGKV